MGTFERFERIKAGASMDEVLAEAAQAEAFEPEVEEPLPTEEEIAAQELADEVDQIDEADEADEAFEEIGGEEEDEST
jgi:hypothetical protein